MLIQFPFFLFIICLIIFELTYFDSLKLIYKRIPRLLVTYYKFKNQEYKNITFSKENDYEKNKNRDCERWIVKTSIIDSTKNVKYLQDALFEWCLVFVCDTKSSPNWRYKDAIFLSLQDQIYLTRRYSIVKEIPTNSYLKKMIGYLYAIEHGAKFIYETDDDYSVLDGLSIFNS